MAWLTLLSHRILDKELLYTQQEALDLHFLVLPEVQPLSRAEVLDSLHGTLDMEKHLFSHITAAYLTRGLT